jgi:hypothetical protein
VKVNAGDKRHNGTPYIPYHAILSLLVWQGLVLEETFQLTLEILALEKGGCVLVACLWGRGWKWVAWKKALCLLS